jgi:pimeloyl-ACP methyl ester carboxylesterase
LVYEMDRNDLAHDAKKLGTQVPDTEVPAAQRLEEIGVPVLILVGEHDTPYMLAAADHMVERIPSARKVQIRDAAHLPNLDHPDVFEKAVTAFVDSLR